jgi:hypothetical protein
MNLPPKTGAAPPQSRALQECTEPTDPGGDRAHAEDACGVCAQREASDGCGAGGGLGPETRRRGRRASSRSSGAIPTRAAVFRGEDGEEYEEDAASEAVLKPAQDATPRPPQNPT